MAGKWTFSDDEIFSFDKVNANYDEIEQEIKDVAAGQIDINASRVTYTNAAMTGVTNAGDALNFVQTNKANLSGGQLTGPMYAQNNVTATAQVRNIYWGTAEPGSLAAGVIYFQVES